MYTYRRNDDAVSGSINAAFAARHSEVEMRLLGLINSTLDTKRFVAASPHLKNHKVIWTDIDRAHNQLRAALTKVRGEGAVEVCTLVIDAA